MRTNGKGPISAFLDALRDFTTPWMRFFAICVRSIVTPGRAGSQLQGLAEEIYPQNARLATLSLERARRLLPGKQQPVILLGQLYLDQGEVDSARACFEEALAIDYSEPQALKGLGFTLHTMGKPREAIYYYLASLDEDADDVDVLVNLSIVFQQLGRPNEAIPHLDRAVELVPNDVTVREQRGRALFAAGRFNDAVEELEQARRLDPRESEVHYLLAVAYETLSDHENAVECFLEAIDRDEHNGWAHLGLSALIDSKLISAEQAVDHAEKAVEIFSSQGHEEVLAQAYWNLGWALYRTDAWDRSIKASRKALEIDPGLNAVRFNLGLSLLCKGQTKRALEEYKRAAEDVNNVWDLRTNGIDDLEAAQSRVEDLAGAEEILTMLREREKELTVARYAAARRGEESPGTPAS